MVYSDHTIPFSLLCFVAEGLAAAIFDLIQHKSEHTYSNAHAAQADLRTYLLVFTCTLFGYIPRIYRICSNNIT